MDALSEIARAVLYEGYILWPYRRTATKNRQRWTFGGVYPPGYALVQSGSDRSALHTECIVEAGAETRITASVRFLQVVQRQILRDEHGTLTPVDALEVSGERHLTWEEAVEREVILPRIDIAPGMVVHREAPVAIDAGRALQPLNSGGARVGAIERSWSSIDGTATVHVAPAPDDSGAYRIGVTVANTGSWIGDARAGALRHTMVSTHTGLRVEGGAFVSMTDPPPRHAAAVAACRNDGTWPVLVGEDGARDTMLSSPIILYDYPRIAPESPGDMFDGGEIDQLLVLNILALSEDERREMRDTDPRAREILDRCATMSGDELMRLHGAMRSFAPLRERDA